MESAVSNEEDNIKEENNSGLKKIMILEKKLEETVKLLNNEKETSKNFQIENEGLNKTLSDLKVDNIKEVSNADLEKIMILEKKLEETVKLLNNENETSKRFQIENEGLNKSISDLKVDFKNKYDQFRKQLDDSKRDKESMVLKYAQSEQKCIESQKRLKELDNRFKETKSLLDSNVKERERLMKDLKVRTTDHSSNEKELYNLKASLTITEQKVKIEELKFSEELEKNKELKKKYDELQMSMIVLKEENQTLRVNCQEIVKTYQDSDDIRSNSLTNSLKQMKDEMKRKEDERKELIDNHNKNIADLKSSKILINTQTQELRILKDKIKHFEADKLCNEESIKQLKETIKTLTSTKEELTTRLGSLEPLESQVEKLKEELTKLKSEFNDLRSSKEDAEMSLNGLRAKECEMLQFIRNMSDNNANLQADKQQLADLQIKLQSTLDKCDLRLRDELIKTQYWEDKFKEESKLWQQQQQQLQQELEAAKTELSNTSLKLADATDEIVSLNKKHKAHIKDLTRQIMKHSSPLLDKSSVAKTTQAKHREIRSAISKDDQDSQEVFNKSSWIDSKVLAASDTSISDQSSRNSSQNLNCNESITPVDQSQIAAQHPSKVTNSRNNDEYNSNAGVEIHTVQPKNQILIDKIVKLQRLNARLVDKIEFLTEHTNHLTQEIQKKSNLLKHMFAASVDSSSVKSELFDKNHQMMAAKGQSIMGSVFSSRANDQHMTLEMALEITNRLQSLLEDTTVKNITLKESINTLGEEISKLSRENNQLKQKNQLYKAEVTSDNNNIATL